MHKLRHYSTVIRYRLGALLVVLMTLSIPAVVGFLVYAIYKGEAEYFLFTFFAIASGLTLVILNYLVSVGAKCPLCTMPPLLSRRCVKNRNAKKLLGSYRLRTAISILFTGKFRCQYCGEITVLKVRPRLKPTVW